MDSSCESTSKSRFGKIIIGQKIKEAGESKGQKNSFTVLVAVLVHPGAGGSDNENGVRVREIQHLTDFVKRELAGKPRK